MKKTNTEHLFDKNELNVFSVYGSTNVSSLDH